MNSNLKIKSITKKLVAGIDVGSETYYTRTFDWWNYEYSKKPFLLTNDEDGYEAFQGWWINAMKNSMAIPM